MVGWIEVLVLRFFEKIFIIIIVKDCGEKEFVEINKKWKRR